jgi:hypothetical protein
VLRPARPIRARSPDRPGLEHSGAIRSPRKALLEARRGTSDQRGRPERNAPAGIFICGSLPGGRVCRGGFTIPLFNIYRAEDGFTNAGISMTVAAYSAATLTTRLVLVATRD